MLERIRKTPPAVIARLAIAALIAIVLTASLFLPRQDAPGTAQNEQAVAALFASSATSPDGKPQALEQWRGRILVVNFWATWCPPCREEMPALSRLSDKFAGKNVQFIGIAIDSADNVQHFVARQRSSYPLLIGAPEALEQSRALGNQRQALPYTVVIDGQGQLRYQRLGGIDEATLERQLNSLTNTP